MKTMKYKLEDPEPFQSGVSEFLEDIKIENMPYKTPEPEPEYCKIEIRKDLIPSGARLVECYLTNKEVIVIGSPEEDDETHDCDCMGCSSASHVIHRFNISDSW